jgi:hypothetical protein
MQDYAGWMQGRLVGLLMDEMEKRGDKRKVSRLSRPIDTCRYLDGGILPFVCAD